MSRLSGCILVGAILSACSSGGEAPPRFIEQQSMNFEDCARVAVVDYHRFMAQIEIVTALAEGRSPGLGLDAEISRSEDSDDPPHTYVFTIKVDTTGDRRLDTESSGKVAFSSNPSTGIDVGSDAMFDYEITRVQDSDGQKDGGADFAVRFTERNQVRVNGKLDANSLDIQCKGWFSMPSSAPMVITFPDDIISGEGSPSTSVDQLETEGSMESEVMSPSDHFRGDIVLEENSNDAQFNGTLNGQPYDDTISYFPDSETIEDLADCSLKMFEVFVELAGTFEDLTEIFIDADRILQDIPNDIPGLTLESSGSPNVVNYTLDFDDFGNEELNGTMTGQLSVYTREQVGSNEITTWQISYDLDASSGLLGDITGKTLDLPVRARIDVDDSYVYWVPAGATIDHADCLGTYQINETEPFEPDLLSGRQTAFDIGRWLFSSMLDNSDDVLEGQIVFTEVGGFATNFKINGIPVPGDVFPPA